MLHSAFGWFLIPIPRLLALLYRLKLSCCLLTLREFLWLGCQPFQDVQSITEPFLDPKPFDTTMRKSLTQTRAVPKSLRDLNGAITNGIHSQLLENEIRVAKISPSPSLFRSTEAHCERVSLLSQDERSKEDKLRSTQLYPDEPIFGFSADGQVLKVSAYHIGSVAQVSSSFMSAVPRLGTWRGDYMSFGIDSMRKLQVYYRTSLESITKITEPPEPPEPDLRNTGRLHHSSILGFFKQSNSAFQRWSQVETGRARATQFPTTVVLATLKICFICKKDTGLTAATKKGAPP
jgi:hypothetical protein